MYHWTHYNHVHVCNTVGTHQSSMYLSACTFWVRPEEITHGAVVRDLLFPVYGAYLVQCVYRGGETAMDTKHLSRLGSRQLWQAENIS